MRLLPDFIQKERVAVGMFLTANFLVFWAPSVFGMGQVWKHALRFVLRPIYSIIDESKLFRRFAGAFIYSKEKYADFFMTGVLSLLNALAGIALVFYVQLTHGYLPWWCIYAYYCIWVGIGGRMMGTAYAYAHKEGHNKTLYQPFIRRTIGNFFENWLGLFYGNVPYNFSTAHVMIHHRLNGGKGDTVYQWDLDRTSWTHLMLYVHRFTLYMMGWSNLQYFADHGMHSQAKLLRKGVFMYWVVVPLVELLITRSPAFVFWIHIQPLICMTFFLAFINTGFHGFIEFENDVNIWCINSTTIIEGDDDYFGEDDHMLHHYATAVYHRDLVAHREGKMDDLKKYHASLFKGFSIVELSVFILAKQWDMLVKHYVDLSGELTPDQIKTMLETRAKRLEMPHDEYCQWRVEYQRDVSEKNHAE